MIMTFAAVKEKLHGYIDRADEKKVKAIFTLVENEIEEPGYLYDDATLNILEERREAYQKSNTRGLTVEESMNHVKEELKKRGF
jgi:hypothetical protein